MPAKTRARVLRAASRSFLRHGYHTSVDEIARRAGVAKQTLYHHFPSKDQLFKEVACDLAKHVLVGLEAEPADVRTGLLRFGLAYRRRVLCAERSEEHTSELQSPCNLVCRLLLEKKKNTGSARLT